MDFTLEKIEPRFVERIWGSTHLAPWFDPPDRKIGEVWFDAGPLLIKFLFTTEALSVQVHPDDEYAAAEHQCAGKTEMWHILRAEPGAQLAVGFRERPTAEQVKQAAIDGSIEQLLGWFEPAAGDTYFTPARVVHALGAGLVVCEVQQTSDITYRLYDYGRGRELHLDHGMAVAELTEHGGKSEPQPAGDGVVTLVECQYFRTESCEWTGRLPWERNSLMIVLSGSGTVDGRPFGLGETWKIPKGTSVEAEGKASILRVDAPEY